MRVLRRTAAVAALAGCAAAIASSSMITTTAAERTVTPAPSPISTDFVAIYYQLYQQQGSGGGGGATTAAATGLPPIVFKQSVPVEVQARLSRYALQFSELPELLKRALLWESGYSLGDSASLAQIHTLCGLSMAELALSDSEFAVTACKISSCATSASNSIAAAGSDWRYSASCRSDQLAPAAKCAITAVDTVSSMPLWSSEPSRNASGLMQTTLLIPDPRVRRHKYSSADAVQLAHVYGIHASIPDTATADACRANTSARAAAVVPCVPYQRSDPRWCRPAPSPIMTTWLDEYTATPQGRQFSHALGSANTSAVANASLQALDVANSSLAATTGMQTKDAHGVYVNAAFAFDGTSSDLAQQLYRRHVAGDDSRGDVRGLIVQEPLPREIAQRLSDASLAFDDLPPLLQRALVWDSGFVVANESNVAPAALLPVLVRCGLGMGDLAVPRARVEQVAASCSMQKCSAPDSSSNSNSERRVTYRSYGCVDDQLARQSACAVVATTLGNTSSNVTTAVGLSMWADGGDDASVPVARLRHHAWQSVGSGSTYEMYSIETASVDSAAAVTSIDALTADSKCPAKASMVIPCMSIASMSASGGSVAQTWCRPRASALVTSWLRQVAKKKEFSLLYLIPILVAVALAVTGLAVYIRRKTIRRFDRKFDDHGTRANTLTSLPDSGVYVPARLSLSLSPHRGSGIAVVDARLSASLSPPSSSSIESFAAFSANHVLHTLVNHPSLRLRTIAYDQIQFLDLLSHHPADAAEDHDHGDEDGDSASLSSSRSPFEVWRACVRGGAYVTVKRLARGRGAEYEPLEALLGEITLSASVEHPNLAAFVGVAWTSLQNVSLLTEFVDGPELRVYLQQHSLQLAWERAKMNIAMGIANALCCLHTLQPCQGGVATTATTTAAALHGDLRSKHVLLTTELEPKLIHAGARAASLLPIAALDAMSAAAAFWTAPEVLRGDAARSERSDMYAFGMVLAELDTHQLPFEELTSSAVRSANVSPLQVLQGVAAGELAPATSPFCPLEVADLIAACVHVDPQQRPSASEAVVVLAKVPIAVVGVKTYSF